MTVFAVQQVFHRIEREVRTPGSGVEGRLLFFVPLVGFRGSVHSYD